MTGKGISMMGFEVLTREFIFVAGVHFTECHASTVLPLPGGNVLAAWFAGSREGADDVSIWLGRRSGDAGWTVEKIAKCDDSPHWNPVLFQKENGEILLFFKMGKPIPRWKTMVMSSVDGGTRWSAPRELVPGDESGGRGPVRCKPVYNDAGAILAPASVETQTAWDAFVDISRNGGGTWTKAPVPLVRSGLAGKGIIQPTLWRSGGEAVHMLLRSTEGRVYRSDSQDGGMSWSPAYPTGLPNNNSGIDVAPVGERLALIYNPVGEDWGRRTPLCLTVSGDNGQSWGPDFAMEDIEGEFSYPAMAQMDGILHITHTWRRQTIEYWRMRLGCV